MQSKYCSSAKAVFDISVVREQLCAGTVSGDARINTATDWTADRCHGDDACTGQHHCRTSRELYVFSEQANRMIFICFENETILYLVM